MTRLRCFVWLWIIFAFKTSPIEPKDSNDDGDVRFAAGLPTDHDDKPFMSYTCRITNETSTRAHCIHDVNEVPARDVVRFLGCCFKAVSNSTTVPTVIECNTSGDSRNCTSDWYRLYEIQMRGLSGTEIAVTVGVMVAIFALVGLCIFCCACTTIAEKKQSDFRKFQPNTVLYS